MSDIMFTSTLSQYDIEKQSPQISYDPYILQDVKGIKLYDYHEIPYFLRWNVYITGGYRAYLSSHTCIKSIFVMSNESINIWSHLLGFFYFFFLFLYDNFINFPSINGITFADHMVFSSLLIGFQVCMLLSTGYHLFGCHSEKVFHCWFALDLAGISIGLCSCYIPAVYYAFYCHQGFQTAYLVGVGLLTALTLVLQMHRHFLSSRWASRRLMLFCSLVIYGIIPSVHWVYLYGGWSQPVVQIFIPKVMVMYALGILALAFYALKIPERYFPGKVNFVGSSHQWWHLFILLAFQWWHYSNLILMEYRITNQCKELHDLQTLDVTM